MLREDGGKGATISCVSTNTPLGLMMVGATGRGLCAVQFGDSHEQLLGMLRKQYPTATIEEMRPPYPSQFHVWMKALASHLDGIEPHLDLPVDVRATAFQLKVWCHLRAIPYGEVQSYVDVATAIGRPKATRAVARACALNQVALVIPCHRVIRRSGELGGYRWGVERKRLLINWERAMRADSPARDHTTATQSLTLL